MWLALLVLFVVLSPGVLFTLPALGKKMGGKFVIALMHSLLFVVVVALLNVTEAFQVGVTTRKVAPKSTPEQTLANAENRLNSLTTSLENLKARVIQKTRELDEGNSRVAQLRQQLQEAQESAQAAQIKVNMKNDELSNAQKEVLDTTARMNMITNQIAASTSSKKGGVSSVVVIQQNLHSLNRSINSTNTSIISAQKAVTAARLALNARNNVKQAEQAPASMDSGSKVQDVAQAAEVAQKAQVDAEKAAQVAKKAELDVVQVTEVAKKAELDATPATPPTLVSSLFGFNQKTISIEGDPRPTPPPPQRMPADLCPTGSWPFMSNGVNDGTGPNSYTTVCMSCASPYRGNPNIPVNINQQNFSNYKFTC